MHYKEAYLIAICDKDTNAIKTASIWSSPEWEQSRCLPDCRTYVALSVRCPTFQDGIDYIKRYIADPKSRYHYLAEYLYK